MLGLLPSLAAAAAAKIADPAPALPADAALVSPFRAWLARHVLPAGDLDGDGDFEPAEAGALLVGQMLAAWAYLVEQALAATRTALLQLISVAAPAALASLSSHAQPEASWLGLP